MNILLIGATGAMGKTVTEVCKTVDGLEIVAGIGLGDGEKRNFPLYQKFEDIKEKIDVVLDFSNHILLNSILEYARENKKPLVIATTGYEDEEVEKIREASKVIPVFFTGNMSLGINVLTSIVKSLSRILEDFDIEIIEKHHNQKKDAPSGTAKMLFNAANEGRDNALTELDSRAGTNLKREKTEVGLHAVRGGSIVGEHTVLFAGLDETIEVTHRAGSKKIFASGALRACKFIVGQPAGMYDMENILDI